MEVRFCFRQNHRNHCAKINLRYIWTKTILKLWLSPASFPLFAQMFYVFKNNKNLFLRLRKGHNNFNGLKKLILSWTQINLNRTYLFSKTIRALLSATDRPHFYHHIIFVQSTGGLLVCCRFSWHIRQTAAGSRSHWCRGYKQIPP